MYMVVPWLKLGSKENSRLLLRYLAECNDCQPILGGSLTYTLSTSNMPGYGKVLSNVTIQVCTYNCTKTMRRCDALYPVQ